MRSHSSLWKRLIFKEIQHLHTTTSSTWARQCEDMFLYQRIGRRSQRTVTIYCNYLEIGFTTSILRIILSCQCEEKLLCTFHFLNCVIGIIPFFTANLNQNFIHRFWNIFYWSEPKPEHFNLSEPLPELNRNLKPQLNPNRAWTGKINRFDSLR